jgi:hypothetical protein
VFRTVEEGFAWIFADYAVKSPSREIKSRAANALRI